MMNFRAFLETAPEFSGLTSQDIEDLEHIMRVSEHPDGYEFFTEGTSGHNVHLIVEGEVSVTHRKGSERGNLEVKRHKAGEMFGLISAITDQKHEASCKAFGPVTIASMPMPVFKLLFGSNSTLALHFQELVTVQLAKDYSSLVNLLRKALFAESEEEIQSTFEQYGEHIYSGPEKRSNERRRPIH